MAPTKPKRLTPLEPIIEDEISEIKIVRDLEEIMKKRMDNGFDSSN